MNKNIHLRNTDRSGKRVNNGGATIVYIVDTESNGDRIVHFGISICSDKDTYNKKQGAELAATRLETKTNGGYGSFDLHAELYEGAKIMASKAKQGLSGVIDEATINAAQEGLTNLLFAELKRGLLSSKLEQIVIHRVTRSEAWRALNPFTQAKAARQAINQGDNCCNQL
jgi:hypothetical protein